VPATSTEEGIRALKGAEVIESESVRRYLESKFGDDLKSVRSAMQRLAESCGPKELAVKAFGLYERLRPDIPAGVKGWGAKGELKLDLLATLARKSS
jgi:hypothetical protein